MWWNATIMCKEKEKKVSYKVFLQASATARKKRARR